MNNHCVQKNSVVMQKKDKWLAKIILCTTSCNGEQYLYCIVLCLYLGQTDVTPQACDFLGLNALCL